MVTNFKTEFDVSDVHLLNLNIIRKKDVLALWKQIRDNGPLKIWIGLVSVPSVYGRKVRTPAWFFLDEANVCYSYLPFSGKIVFQGFYHRQYPRIWWIYTKNYYCGDFDNTKNYVALIAIGNIMMAI